LKSKQKTTPENAKHAMASPKIQTHDLKESKLMVDKKEVTFGPF
jgi:hypothetical protein